MCTSAQVQHRQQQCQGTKPAEFQELQQFCCCPRCPHSACATGPEPLCLSQRLASYQQLQPGNLANYPPPAVVCSHIYLTACFLLTMLKNYVGFSVVQLHYSVGEHEQHPLHARIKHHGHQKHCHADSVCTHTAAADYSQCRRPGTSLTSVNSCACHTREQGIRCLCQACHKLLKLCFRHVFLRELTGSASSFRLCVDSVAVSLVT